MLKELCSEAQALSYIDDTTRREEPKAIVEIFCVLRVFVANNCHNVFGGESYANKRRLFG